MGLQRRDFLLARPVWDEEQRLNGIEQSGFTMLVRFAQQVQAIGNTRDPGAVGEAADIGQGDRPDFHSIPPRT